MLLSLKAGGVGLNLTAANHLLLLDPAWNPASEWQCFDRTHRLVWLAGQCRAITFLKWRLGQWGESCLSTVRLRTIK